MNELKYRTILTISLIIIIIRMRLIISSSLEVKMIKKIYKFSIKTTVNPKLKKFNSKKWQDDDM